MGIFLLNKHNNCIIWRCLVLTVLLAFIYCSCPAQSSLLDKKMSLSKKGYTIYELCNAIEKQIDASVSYNSAKIKSSKKIYIAQHATDLKTLLGMLKKDYGIDCNIAGNHIILIPEKGFADKKLKHRRHKRRVEKQIESEQKQKKANQGLEEEKTNAAPQADSGSDTIIIDVDTGKGNRLTSGNAAGGSVGNINYESEPAGAQRWNFLKNNLIAGISAYTSQPYYFNLQAELGFKYVYLSAAYAFKGNGLGHWRLGGGFTIPVSDRLDMGLYVNYGTGINSIAPYSYETIVVLPPVDSASDSTVITTTHTGSVSVDQNLFKAGISVSYKITSAISVFISPCFNTLNTAYYQNGTAASLRSVIPEPVVIKEEDFQPLNTGLNISNDFNPDAASYRKNWISIDVGIRINIFPKNSF